MVLNIRKMTMKDIDEVYAIEKAAHITPWTKQILYDCVRLGYDCRVIVLISGHQSQLVGYLIARYRNKRCHILNLCIKKEKQAKGFGKRLLQTYLYSINLFLDIESAVLEVRSSNVIALKLYAHFGFKPIDIKKKYYKDQHNVEDAIVLLKKM